MIKEEWFIADSKKRPGRKTPTPLLGGCVLMALFLANVIAFLFVSQESQHNKYYSLGLESYHAGNFQEAEVDFRKDVRYNPEHSLAHYYLGRSELHLSKRDAAAIQFDLAYQAEMHSKHPNLDFANKCKNYRDQLSQK